MPIAQIKLAEIQQARSIVDKEGRPTADFLRVINGNIRNIRAVLTELVDFANAIQEAQDAAELANEAALIALDAAETVDAAVVTISGAITDLDARVTALEP
jgi:hypothetical protein